jgi:hypothetical protein
MRTKVFLTYANPDGDYAQNLANLLEEGGFDAWHDAEMQPGENWEDAILKNLRESPVILLLMSENLKDSKNSLVELGAAFGLGKKIIPISISDSMEDSLGVFEKQEMVDGKKLNKEGLFKLIEEAL